MQQFKKGLCALLILSSTATPSTQASYFSWFKEHSTITGIAGATAVAAVSVYIYQYLNSASNKAPEVTSSEMPANVTPENTEIFWDIHNVIIKKSPTAMLATMYNTPEKVAILRHGFNWGLWKDIITLLRSGSTGGAFVNRLEQEDPRLATFAKNMANSQVPIDGMQDLISKLASNKYKMSVASNIGSNVFPDLKAKYSKIFSDSVIQDGKTVDFSADQPVEKPEPAFFDDLNKNYKTKERAIFIDDSKRNVAAAQKAGMFGVLFKNAEQLEKELESLLS